jgi:hypothetical protein
MRRPEVGELREQIPVRPDHGLRHLPVREDSQEGAIGIIGERPSVAREGSWARRVIGQHLRQQCRRRPPGVLRRIPSRAFQRMREPGYETGIVGRFSSEIGLPLLPDQVMGLGGERAAVALGPTLSRGDQRACPQADAFGAQVGVG